MLQEPTVTLTQLRPPRKWADSRAHLSALITSGWYRALLVLYGEVANATAQFYQSRGVHWLFVPATTGSISSPMGLGSDSLPVEIHLRGNRVYLADSMQFLLELGTRLHEGGVYYLSCSHRGEPVDHRHLREFCHSEVEIVGGLQDGLGLAEAYVTHLVRHLYDRCPREVAAVAGGVDHLERVLALSGRFPRIRFDEAFGTQQSRDLWCREVCEGAWAVTEPGERALLQQAGSEAVWLTHMPQLTCPFYQCPEPGTEYCLSADLILGHGEVLGLGARCPDAETLRRSLAFHQVAEEPYEWYVQMKETQPLQTVGFGLGIERFLMWVMRSPDIRDCTLWIRDESPHQGP